jgi:acetoin utilization deacetylase AcuC-like enzyme
MSARRVTAVVQDSRFLDHRGPPGHPERPERLAAVAEALESRRAHLRSLSPRAASLDEIATIHDRDHIERVARACERAPAHLDPDTFVSAASFEIAKLAVGGTVDLVRAIAAGEVDAGFAAVRPPGHHAESNRAMGFCLFNNAAIAVRALQERDGLERILILDWDVHHGNGTQHSFEDDPTVLYVSTHEYPQYPGTGAASEAGHGRGAGFTLNVPMPSGCGDAEYVGVLQRLLAPAARSFRPEFLLVSCGFDTHRDDPLAGMQVTGDGFVAMSAIVRRLADELCGGRLAFVLEGGYSLQGLREGTTAVLDAMLAVNAPAAPEAAALEPGSLLARIVEPVVAVHRANFPGIGTA